ncbi:APC family permease [Paraburkholderia sp. J63]|uniref:APC family permease n=1 Tax=Paraburkholderia sp. J63 TaxID=2805434 RepID=UPI002ABE04DA|nr:amino acid permease [Paraburkholderia sp. J63]
MSDAATTGQPGERIALLKVLGPIHVWALGVGIVLVGEFMGWNFSVAKGGAYGSLIACWIIGLLYTCVAMIDSEVTSTVAAAGGQYTQAKHIIGPLMAFNVGLYLVMAYTMLEAADALVVGDLIKAVAADSGYVLDSRPFALVTIAFLAWLNYRGVFVTLTVNFVITAIAFLAIVVLFFGVQPWNPGQVLLHHQLLTQLPYGWLGVVAALQFGMWYYLGIEGTCQAAEEVRSAGRSIPLGTMCGMITLLIAAALTWYVATGLMPWEYLGQAVTPLYDAARLTGNKGLQTLLFVGTLFSAIASANGCINDASRAWFSMSRDRYMPMWFGAVHPRYRTPYRAIIFLVPIAISFAFTGLLDQVITFSILSGLLGYTFMSINIVKFRRKWPLGSINRGYVHPFHPIPAIVLACLCSATYFATYLGYGASLLSIMAFYIVASIWFALHRYKYVKRGDQFTMSWPRPKDY